MGKYFGALERNGTEFTVKTSSKSFRIVSWKFEVEIGWILEFVIFQHFPTRCRESSDIWHGTPPLSLRMAPNHSHVWCSKLDDFAMIGLTWVQDLMRQAETTWNKTWNKTCPALQISELFSPFPRKMVWTFIALQQAVYSIILPAFCLLFVASIAKVERFTKIAEYKHNITEELCLILMYQYHIHVTLIFQDWFHRVSSTALNIFDSAAANASATQRCSRIGRRPRCATRRRDNYWAPGQSVNSQATGLQQAAWTKINTQLSSAGY